MLSARRRRWVLCEFEYQVEDGSDIFGEVRNVLVERAVIDGKETNLIVLERNELCEVGRADFVEILRCAAAANAQDQFDLDEGKLRFDR